MKPLTLIIGALIANSVIASHSWAQTGKELDITMTIVDESDSPSVIINRIELPPATAFTTPAVPPSSLATDANVTDTLDQVQDDLQQVTGDVLDTTSDVLTNTINDTLSTGEIEQLPGDIIDNLPDELPEDLLPIPVPGDLVPKPDNVIEIPIDNPLDTPLTNPLGNGDATSMDSDLDSALDIIEQESPIDLEEIPETNLPLPREELLLNDINTPVQP